MHNTANCASREKSFMWFLREVSSEIHVKFMWKLTWFSHKFNGKSLSREIHVKISREIRASALHTKFKSFTWGTIACERTRFIIQVFVASPAHLKYLSPPRSQEKKIEKSLHALISLSAYNVGLRGLYLDE